MTSTLSPSKLDMCQRAVEEALEALEGAKAACLQASSDYEAAKVEVKEAKNSLPRFTTPAGRRYGKPPQIFTGTQAAQDALEEYKELKRKLSLLEDAHASSEASVASAKEAHAEAVTALKKEELFRKRFFPDED